MSFYPYGGGGGGLYGGGTSGSSGGLHGGPTGPGGLKRHLEPVQEEPGFEDDVRGSRRLKLRMSDPDRGGMSSMDGRLGGMDGRLGGMDGRMGGMDGRMGGIDGRMGGMDSRMGGMDGRMGGMDGRSGGMDSRMGMDGRMGGMDGRMGGMDGRMGGMDGRMGGMDGRMGGMDGRMGGMDGHGPDSGPSSGGGHKDGETLTPEDVRVVLERSCGTQARIDAETARLVARMAERVMDEMMGAAAKIARHRGSGVLEVSDMKLALGSECGLWSEPTAEPGRQLS